jgi:hypothetical protein
VSTSTSTRSGGLELSAGGEENRGETSSATSTWQPESSRASMPCRAPVAHPPEETITIFTKSSRTSRRPDWVTTSSGVGAIRMLEGGLSGHGRSTKRKASGGGGPKPSKCKRRADFAVTGPIPVNAAYLVEATETSRVPCFPVAVASVPEPRPKSPTSIAPIPMAAPPPRTFDCHARIPPIPPASPLYSLRESGRPAKIPMHAPALH